MVESYVKVLAAAFALGFAAAAPIGPVNMVAIHRGVVGRWTHTLACGLGSTIVDASYFALVVVGGHQLIAYLQNPFVRAVLLGIGACVLIPLGARYLYKAIRFDPRTLLRARRSKRDRPPVHLWTDVGTGFLITVVNPGTLSFWLIAGTAWLASVQQNASAPELIGWGILAAFLGQLGWFVLLTVFVRFMPNRIGPRFFRTVNAISGTMLVGFGVFCATTLILHLF